MTLPEKGRLLWREGGLGHTIYANIKSPDKEVSEALLLSCLSMFIAASPTVSSLLIFIGYVALLMKEMKNCQLTLSVAQPMSTMFLLSPYSTFYNIIILLLPDLPTALG